jgi:hypothetical protein
MAALAEMEDAGLSPSQRRRFKALIDDAGRKDAEMAAAGWLVFLALRSTLVLAAALGLERLLRRKPAAGRHVPPDARGRRAAADAGAVAAAAAVGARDAAALARAVVAGGPTFGRRTGSAAAVAAREAEPPKAATLVPTLAVRRAVATRKSRGRSLVRPRSSSPRGSWARRRLLGLARALRSEEQLRPRRVRFRGPGSTPPSRRAARSACRGRLPLLTSDAIETPLTSRWPSPAVLLPIAAEGWPDERRRVVVQHELVHLARETRGGCSRGAWSRPSTGSTRWRGWPSATPASSASRHVTRPCFASARVLPATPAT